MSFHYPNTAWRPTFTNNSVVDAMSYANNPALEAARMTREAKKRVQEIAAKEGDNNVNQSDE